MLLPAKPATPPNTLATFQATFATPRTSPFTLLQNLQRPMRGRNNPNKFWNACRRLRKPQANYETRFRNLRRPFPAVQHPLATCDSPKRAVQGMKKARAALMGGPCRIELL